MPQMRRKEGTIYILPFTRWQLTAEGKKIATLFASTGHIGLEKSLFKRVMLMSCAFRTRGDPVFGHSRLFYTHRYLNVREEAAT
jgi:hypothetical protein